MCWLWSGQEGYLEVRKIAAFLHDMEQGLTWGPLKAPLPGILNHLEKLPDNKKQK